MNLPSYLQNYQAPDIGAALSANLGSAMPPHVSIEGGRFTLIDASNAEIPVPTFDPTLGVYLDACIIDVNNVKSRIYYPGSYDGQAPGMRPTCFSDNGQAPSIHAESPQARSCQPDPDGTFGCKLAVWGSKINPNGKKVPACKETQKIALLIPGFPTLFVLAVPPNSHSYLREYTEKCKGNDVNIANLITRISFVPGIQGTLQFQPFTYIDEPTAVLRQAAYAEKKTDALVGRTDVPRPAGMIAAPAQQAAPTQVSPAPATGFAQIAPQVQQSSPFVTPATFHVQTAQPGAQTAAGAGFATQPASSTDPAPQQRRRRRTAAEMAAANGATPAGQAPQQPASAPQTPFPHPGQQAAATQVAVPQQNFGITQPAAANPELSAMLDDFFK